MPVRGTLNDFILSATSKHGNKYDYSKSIYYGSKEKLEVIHNECGNKFEVSPNSHLRGSGCPACFGKIKRTNETFIVDARKVHGDNYDYSEAQYVNKDSKVTIIHKSCGYKFNQTPGSHINGRRKCPKCAGNMKLTQEDFIKKCTYVHGDQYDYSKCTYVNTDTKVSIIHKICGYQFDQTPDSHINGKSGCPKCVGNMKLTDNELMKKCSVIHGNKYRYDGVLREGSNVTLNIHCFECGINFERTSKSHIKSKIGCYNCCGYARLNQQDFIDKCKTIYGDEFDYSKSIYVGAVIKITIIHNKCGNEFMQKPNAHLSGKMGCDKCKCNSKKNTEIFVKQCIEIRGDYYDYSKVNYVSNKHKVTLIHKLCSHEFNVRPSNFLYKFSTCPKCAGHMLKTKEQFIEESKLIHGDKYDYSKVNYINTSIKVGIVCVTCNNKFNVKPNNHLSRKSGCNACAYVNNGLKSRINVSDYFARFKEMHGDEYDYSKTLLERSDDKIITIHKKCGYEFIQRANYHKSGGGCTKCRISKGEVFIQNYLVMNDILFEQQKRFHDCRDINVLPFDFYISKINTCIEYDGVQHSEPVEFFGGEEGYIDRVKKDRIKTDYCNVKGINLCRIKYTENPLDKLAIVLNSYINNN